MDSCSLQASSSICVFCALLPIIMNNGRVIFTDESWQDMYSNNTGSPSDVIPPFICHFLEEEIESYLRTHRGVSHTGADLRGADFFWANMTKANLSNANLEGAPATGNKSFKGSTITGGEKIPWSVEEVLKMIVGVASTTSETGRKRWKEILEKYFKDGKRTKDILKQKWKDLNKQHAIKRKDEQWLLYVMAAIVEGETQSDKTKVFENVIKKWCVTSERKAKEKLVRKWLNIVKNMGLEQQLDLIKYLVTAAEQGHAYDTIRYWSYQVHP
ncbi:unnamed protein product [Camellia sinensis]